MDEIRIELIINKENAYFNADGICFYEEINEDAYEDFKEMFSPMMNELKEFIIMSNIEKELAEQ